LTRSLNGAVMSDAVSLSGGSAAFANKNVGTGKTVMLTGASLAGGDAGNYVLDSVATTTADITTKHITGTFTAAHKVYDGNTSATVLTGSLIGTIGGDAVSLMGGTATFASKNVGTDKTVTLSGATLAGGDAGNYTLDSVATTTANITHKNLTVAGITANNKPWDGNTVASLNLGAASAVGVVTGDAVALNTAGASGNFSSSAVGTWTVTIAGLTIAGGDAPNYSVTQPTTTASIQAWTAQGTGFYEPVGVTSSYFVAAPGSPPTPTASTIWNSIKGGQTVPLKFKVFAGSVERTDLAAITAFTASKVNCSSGSSEDAVDFVTTGNTSLRYDGGQWIQNWKTPSGSDCYRATALFADGSSLSAFFKLKK
jgi:YDG domain